MNIFFKELKSHRKSLIIWSLALILFVAGAMVKYDATSAAGDSLTSLLNDMPKAFQSMLGLGYFDINTPIGFFGATFIYLMLLGAIHGSMLGATILSSEESDKTSEFLMVKPVTRNMVVLSKMYASIFIILLFNIVVFVSSFLIVDSHGNGQSNINDVFLLMVGFFIVEMIFFFIGFFLSTVLKRAKMAPSIVTAILLITFIMSVLADMFDSVSWFKYLSPFSYFDPKVLLGFISMNMVQVGIGLSLIVVLCSLSFIFYNKRDLEI
ncbi:MAG: ABC transporter permease subunit [Firmicutes bacterium]|nr:ABC transporter permease subunit [Bacillota bacterium]